MNGQPGRCSGLSEMLGGFGVSGLNVGPAVLWASGERCDWTLICWPSSNHYSATSTPIPIVFSICFFMDRTGHLTAAAWTGLVLYFCHSPMPAAARQPHLHVASSKGEITSNLDTVLSAHVTHRCEHIFLSTLLKYGSFHCN